MLRNHVRTSLRALALLLLAIGPVPRASERTPAQDDEAAEASDVAGVPWEACTVEGEERMRYHLIGYDTEAEAPEDGYRLLLVLPGGDGQAGFRDFVRRIHEHVLDDAWVVAQLIAPVWTDDQEIVWPTEGLRTQGMEFTTGEFLEAVREAVEERLDVDPRYVFAMGWSSSGTAVYRAALEQRSKLTGAFVAMSVWKPDLLPSLRHAKERAFAILHSAEDFIPIAMAEEARDRLTAAKARVHYATYAGGHGWRDDPFGKMRAALEWLVENHAEPPRRR